MLTVVSEFHRAAFAIGLRRDPSEVIDDARHSNARGRGLGVGVATAENAVLRESAELAGRRTEDARRALIDANTRSDAVFQSQQATLADEREQQKIREARSAEQYAGLSRVLGQQVSDLKTKNESLEKQLLKARQDADATVGSIVRDAINALSDQPNQNASRSEASLAAIDLIAKSMLNEMRAGLLSLGNVVEGQATSGREAARTRRQPLASIPRPASTSSELCE